MEAVLTTLGMAPCEGSDAVPPNARCGPCVAQCMQPMVGCRWKDAFWGRCMQDACPFLLITRGLEDPVKSTVHMQYIRYVVAEGEVHMAHYEFRSFRSS